MNLTTRTENRQTNKILKAKLTNEQFEELKSKTMQEQIISEVNRFIANFVEVFVPAMKENHISEERTNRIIEELYSKTRVKFRAGDIGEPRP